MSAHQRGDLTQSNEDYERVMEDYFQLVHMDLRYFQIEKTYKWEYNEFDKVMVFYFETEWMLDEFLDKMRDCPKKFVYEFEEYTHVDREKLTIKIIGLIGGLY